MDVLLYNSAVCRLCGEENENGSLLYSCEENEQILCDVINAYLPMKVSDDGQLPRTICPGCTIQLEATVEFLNLIINGQKIIRELHQREKEYTKSLQKKTSGAAAEPEIITKKIVYEISTEDGVYQVEHPISLQVAGLDKPKRKRGRPPKKPKTPEELAQEALERQQEAERKSAEAKNLNSSGEATGKRRRKTPTRFREAVQGKELERIFKEEGMIDAEESDQELKADVSEIKEPVSKEPEVIGHLETGELVMVLKGKGRGRPKGRMRPTREECAICGMTFSCVGRYMSHVASHGPVVYQCAECDTTFDTRLTFNSHQEDSGHKGQIVKSKKLKSEEELSSATPVFLHHASTWQGETAHEEQVLTQTLKPEEVSVQKQPIDPLCEASHLDILNEREPGTSPKSVVANAETAESQTDQNADKITVDSVCSPVKSEGNVNETSTTENIAEEPEGESPAKGKGRLKCNLCDKTFSSRQSKSMHMKATHAGERPYKCLECGMSFPYPRSLSIHAIGHRRTNSSKGFACDLCGKVLNHPSSVIYHKEAQHAGRQYVCLKCGKGFKHKQLLQRHQLVHSQLRPYTCKTCTATFKTKANLMNHQLLHTGVKKYACEICKHRFAHKTSLTLHMRLHTGLKPFSCNVCGKSFSQKGNLSEHARIHTGEKPYKCNLCPRSFTTSSQHRLHARRHTPDRMLVCTHCGKRFGSRESWRVHMRREAGVRAHRCASCGRGFCERWALLKHQRRHTGEKPFVCAQCPRAFADCSNLNKHKKQVHKQTSLLVNDKNRLQQQQELEQQQLLEQKQLLEQHTLEQQETLIAIEDDASQPEGEERVIYVTYDVDGESDYHIIDQQHGEDEDLSEPRVLELYSEPLLDPQEQEKEQEQGIYLESDVIEAPDDVMMHQQHMAVTDEQGNPMYFTMQDGTRLAITSTDGKSLQAGNLSPRKESQKDVTSKFTLLPFIIGQGQVITHDGQTIPVEINGLNDIEITMEEEELESAPSLLHQLNQKTAGHEAPVAHYFTIE